MPDATAVIIPSLNSPIIDRVVDAVLAQEGLDQPLATIIVGRDEANLVPTHPAVRFIDTEKPMLAATARNRGAAASDAELLLFLDSDCLPSPGWAAAHIAAHEAGHAVVSGSVFPAGTNYWHLTYNLTLFHEILTPNPPGPRPFLPTLNLSVERGVIDEVGGMNQQIDRVEDVDWTTRMRRAGYAPYFWPDASVYHAHNRTTMRQVWDDCALSGRYMRRLRLRHRDLLRAPSLFNYPRLLLALSPLVAASATLNILLQRRYVVRRYWRTIPALYLTKLAWCWGASRPIDKAETGW